MTDVCPFCERKHFIHLFLACPALRKETVGQAAAAWLYPVDLGNRWREGERNKLGEQARAEMAGLGKDGERLLQGAREVRASTDWALRERWRESAHSFGVCCLCRGRKGRLEKERERERKANFSKTY